MEYKEIFTLSSCNDRNWDNWTHRVLL